MNQTITKNEKSIKILNKLIADGFYTGYIGPERFELVRNHFPNNHRLLGLLNENGKYEIKLDFKYPMNIAVKILLILGILTSIISVIRGNWLIPISLVVFGVILFVDFKIKQKKEIERFTNKFLEFDRKEY